MSSLEEIGEARSRPSYVNYGRLHCKSWRACAEKERDNGGSTSDDWRERTKSDDKFDRHEVKQSIFINMERVKVVVRADTMQTHTHTNECRKRRKSGPQKFNLTNVRVNKKEVIALLDTGYELDLIVNTSLFGLHGRDGTSEIY